MSARIRYVSSTQQGIKQSARNFEVGSMSLSVSLNLNDLTFVVQDENTKVVVATGGEISEQMLKKSARTALESFGVQLVKETRGGASFLSAT